jgi:hypothetical protein
MITIPRWVGRLVLPLLLAELAKAQVRARADLRWAADAVRLQAAVDALRVALNA